MNGKETRKEHELRRWLLQQDNASEAQHIVGWSDDSTMTWFKHADGKPYRSPISRGLREFLNKHASYGPEEIEELAERACGTTRRTKEFLARIEKDR